MDEINKTGTTILMVTHEHELVNRFHHRTVTLEKGRIIRDQEVLPMFKNSFGYLVKEGLHNIRANRQMSVASIGVLIACMVLIGGALLLSSISIP